ncbi:DUF7266 family protein [Halorubrum lipolyticum]|uniref:Uncharacterized protein n=1 Tax=Halorubrum lipolyticum DSM 21995 TaxID=1227482 RepID=M0P2W9_9EURY|nr:hypothetical protein [Halorubrum lipolyticum]EMA63145.1 hypothetical protein C469_03955 [Halorubrum lipolyticum DSM 21995]
MRDRLGSGSTRLRRDERGVSVTVGYVLTLAIGAILLSGVVIGVGGVVDSQTDRTVQSDLAVLGQTAAANVESADRLARAAEADRSTAPGAANATVSVAVDLPTRVAGVPYRIAVDDDAVTLRTDSPEASLEIPHAARLNVTPTSVRGGPIRIEYDHGGAGAGNLTVVGR